MKNLKLLGILVLSCLAMTISAQKNPYAIFNDSKIINNYSVETLGKGYFDFRISHRFGDMLGDNGGWRSFFGLENAADISIGLDYGITDNLMVGIYRSKGAANLSKLVNGHAKWRIFKTKGSRPASMAIVGLVTASTMEKSESKSAINYFPKFSHRFIYHGQMLVGKRFSPVLSTQVSLAYTHRNYVPFGDFNSLFSVGLASRVQLNKSIGILLDANYPISLKKSWDNGYYFPLGIGIEWTTGGGHVFQMNFTNSRGIAETDFIPYSTSNWLDGQFRLGFTISRQFKR